MLRPMPTTTRPATLAERVQAMPVPGLVKKPGLVAFPHHWQVPAATEMAAYDALSQEPPPTSFDYFGFPWATVIDGLRGDAATAPAILMALRGACESCPPSARRASVAQHIHALQFIWLFKACGITDLFWSHATHDCPEIGGIRLHPFPLFPAQTPCQEPPAEPERQRRYLANFIGAYNPKIYLTNVRGVIFDDTGAQDDVLIVKRKAWHFDRIVYEEQIRGATASAERLATEDQQTAEYLDAIRASWFTLCPSGSGPNSIRIFESLCLGSIPIVLTQNLRLPGPQALWEQAAIVEEDSAAGYERAKSTVRGMSMERRVAMLRAGRELCAQVNPAAFGRLISSAMASDAGNE
jgi:hypothetical protein